MNDRIISTTFLVEQTPSEVFAAINNVSGWWSGTINGCTDRLGGEFTFRYRNLHTSKQRVTEFVPGRRVVWLVVDSKLTFVAEQGEWTGTKIAFDISVRDGKTEVRFTHVGLDFTHECFAECSSAWGSLINGKLRKLIAGYGRPGSLPD